MAEFRGTHADFRQRVNDLCERYKRLSGFQWRVQQAKLLEFQVKTAVEEDLA